MVFQLAESPSNHHDLPPQIPLQLRTTYASSHQRPEVADPVRHHRSWKCEVVERIHSQWS